MSEKIRLGFVPSHRVPFDENWAVEMRRRTLKVLEQVEEIEVIAPGPDLTPGGLVRDDDDAEKVVRMFGEAGVEGLIIGTMTFGDEVSAVHVAEELAVPVLLFGTKEGAFVGDGRRRSDSFCGTLSVSSGLYRRKIPFVFLGIVFPEEPEFADGVRKFAGTCMAVREFLGARVGLVGPRPERFETCAFDELPLIEQFGQRIVPLSLVDLFRAVREVKYDDPEVRTIVDEVRSRVDRVQVSEEVLFKSARLELALRDFARSKGLSGMGIQCWTAMEEEYEISPCLAMGRLTDQGIMCACEVDILGVLTMLIQYASSLKQAVPHFIDWTIQHQHEENTFLAWHCGNAPMSLAGGSICIRGHSVMDVLLGEKRVGGTAEMQLKPGTVTLSRLVEYDGRFKLLLTKGEVIPSDQKLRGSWAWVRVQDLKRLYRTLVEEGFVHHASLVHGDRTWEIREFCKFAGIEVVEV